MIASALCGCRNLPGFAARISLTFRLTRKNLRQNWYSFEETCSHTPRRGDFRKAVDRETPYVVGKSKGDPRND